MRNIYKALLLILSLNCVEAIGADWKLAGYATIFKNEKVYVYYDAEGVENKSNGIIKVWTKSITETEVNLMLKKKDKEITDKAANRLINGQYLLYATVKKLSFDDMVSLLPVEEVANVPGIKTRSIVLFEINCKEKRIRNLSITTFTDEGAVKRSGREGAWDYISPESNGETLSKMLCK